MNRRNFIRNTALMGIPFALKGIPVAALPYFSPTGKLSEDNDKILVLIQLIGGNDGLNTFIPLNHYKRLTEYRGDILIPERQLLPLTNDLALHSNMAGVKFTYDNDQMTIIQDVGYPNQNRSHFRSTDIWSTASSSEEVIPSGWLGRYFDEGAPGFPEGYPNPTNPDPFAVAIGRTIANTCQGELANFSLAVNNPFQLSPIVSGEAGSLPDNYYGYQLKFLRNAIDQSNAYGEVIKAAAEKGQSLSTLYPEDANRLAQQLKIVAQLISGGLQSKVYVVQLGGFDTHGDQVLANDPTQGRHAELLDTLATAVGAFQDDLNLLGLEERVIGMTFSEFGRRIRSNGSLGTDHGTAAPLMVFGNCVNSGIIGTNAQLPDEVEQRTGVPMQHDFRDVYGSILQDWFGMEEDSIRNLLFPDYDYIPILNNCGLATSTNEYYLDRSLSLFPQPANGILNLSFDVDHNRNGILSILDLYGRVLQNQSLQNLPKGKNQLSLNIAALPKGQYILRIQLGNTNVSKKFIKM